MSYTESDLTVIRKAIAKGVLRAEYSDGTSVTYRSMEEMFQAENRIASFLETQNSTGITNRTLRVTYDD